MQKRFLFDAMNLVGIILMGKMIIVKLSWFDVNKHIMRDMHLMACVCASME
jgi:hypothetical protein